MEPSNPKSHPGPRAARQATSAVDDLPHEIWPLDYLILKALPNENEMLGGVHYVGRRARDLSDQFGEHVTVPQINTRLRICKLNALVIDRPASGGRVWQRTHKGVELLRQRGDLDAPQGLRAVADNGVREPEQHHDAGGIA